MILYYNVNSEILISLNIYVRTKRYLSSEDHRRFVFIFSELKKRAHITAWLEYCIRYYALKVVSLQFGKRFT